MRPVLRRMASEIMPRILFFTSRSVLILNQLCSAWHCIALKVDHPIITLSALAQSFTVREKPKQTTMVGLGDGSISDGEGTEHSSP
jgi:hypothetical protein